MSIKYHDVNVGVTLGSGGGSTIISKTITTNGTYNASSDNADGYDPVVVNVSGDIENWDFTGVTPAVGLLRGWTLTNSGVTFGSAGCVFDSASDYLSFGTGLKAPIRIQLGIGAMSLPSISSHQRFIMGTTANGFIYRSNGKWAFYNNSWQETTETDGSFFANSTVEILVDSTNHWHIYKNGTLWWEPTGAQALSGLFIGSSAGQSINNAEIKSMSLL